MICCYQIVSEKRRKNEDIRCQRASMEHSILSCVPWNKVSHNIKSNLQCALYNWRGIGTEPAFKIFYVVQKIRDTWVHAFENMESYIYGFGASTKWCSSFMHQCLWKAIKKIERIRCSWSIGVHSTYKVYIRLRSPFRSWHMQYGLRLWTLNAVHCDVMI